MKKLAMKKIVLLVGTLVLAGVAAVAQAADVRFAVQDSNGTTDKMVVTDQGYVGIGAPSPIYPFQISLGGPSSASTLEFRNTGNSTYSQYDAPTIQMMRNNSATATGGNGSVIPQNNDRLGYLTFGSYFSGLGPKYAAGIVSNADSASWSGTSYPGSLSFMTTSSTGTYPSERVRITSTGLVGIGTNIPTQQLEVKGGVRLNTTAGIPACNASSRGTIWFSQGGSGVADTFKVCAKDVSNNYSWNVLF